MENSLKKIMKELECLSEIRFIVFVYVDEAFGGKVDSIGISWENAPNTLIYHSQNVQEDKGHMSLNLAVSARLNDFLKKDSWTLGPDTSPGIALEKNENRGYSLIIPKASKSKRYRLCLVRHKRAAVPEGERLKLIFNLELEKEDLRRHIEKEEERIENIERRIRDLKN